MSLPVGIDLGTTNSVISVYKRGRPETLKVDGSSTMPSAVCFRDQRTTYVGSKALGMAQIRPESTVLSVKRHMGTNKSYVFGKNQYSPVDISQIILEKLCEGQEEHLGGPPTHAVITVPAYFTDDQRKDTKLAGEQAGLKVLRLLPEPTAAAIAIGMDKGRDQTIMVYDLGGGTFDVSILEVKDNNFEVRAVNGNHDLGGNDFDVAIRDYALDEFAKKNGFDLRQKPQDDPDVRQAIQVLTTSCERIKMELSEAEQAFLDLPSFYQGTHLEMNIERRTFEGLIKELVYETKELTLKTIAEAGLDADDIDRLMLVGGSTKIPLVGRVLGDTVKEPFVADNVDLAVSEGASIMAANLYAIEEAASAPVDYAPIEINVTDVVSHPISVAMLGETGKLECEALIKKNEPLPSSAMTSGAVEPGQRVGQLPVFRGESIDPDENEYLGNLTLQFDPSREPQFIRFELMLDESGLLIVEGAILDLEGRYPSEALFMNLNQIKVKRKVRAEIRLPS